jgi:hypothetical protein
MIIHKPRSYAKDYENLDNKGAKAELRKLNADIKRISNYLAGEVKELERPGGGDNVKVQMKNEHRASACLRLYDLASRYDYIHFIYFGDIRSENPYV